LSQPSIQELHALVKEFLSKVPSIKQPEFHEFDIREVYPKHDGDPWRVKPGIYYFSVGDDVKYVGKGTSESGVGYRIYKGLSRIGLVSGFGANPKTAWKDTLSDPSSKVGIYVFEDSDFHWPSSLEEFLIRSLNPILNRIGRKSG
jgi:hypothetical protein